MTSIRHSRSEAPEPGECPNGLSRAAGSCGLLLQAFVECPSGHLYPVGDPGDLAAVERLFERMFPADRWAFPGYRFLAVPLSGGVG